MSQLSRSDLCELLDVIKNNVSTWTNEDMETDGQLRPICEHMWLVCNMMWATLTDALGENCWSTEATDTKWAMYSMEKRETSDANYVM